MIKRSWCWVRYYFFSMAGAMWHAQERRCRQAKALMQARRYHQLELRCLHQQAEALKGMYS